MGRYCSVSVSRLVNYIIVIARGAPHPMDLLAAFASTGRVKYSLENSKGVGSQISPGSGGIRSVRKAS